MPDSDNEQPGSPFLGPRAQLSHPVPVEGSFGCLGSSLTPLALIGGAGAFLFLASGMFGRTAGSRHSTRLKWQERQQQARAEIEESEAAKKKSP